MSLTHTETDWSPITEKSKELVHTSDRKTAALRFSDLVSEGTYQNHLVVAEGDSQDRLVIRDFLFGYFKRFKNIRGYQMTPLIDADVYTIKRHEGTPTKVTILSVGSPVPPGMGLGVDGTILFWYIPLTMVGGPQVPAFLRLNVMNNAKDTATVINLR